RAIAASVEGIARNPSAAPAIRLAMIIGLALIESLVIYALLIAFFVYQL
ncbi:MAG TPA: ATP synthase F0 subunit C, partial [Thermoanaerobaculia bacterium]|nr:ATP synthase F0 subunit C [Thermoanaerobaculia bacterium]